MSDFLLLPLAEIPVIILINLKFMNNTTIQLIQETHCSNITLARPKFKFCIKIEFKEGCIIIYQKSFKEYLSDILEKKDGKKNYCISFLRLEFECDPLMFIYILGELEPNRFNNIYQDLKTGINCIDLVFTLKETKDRNWIRSKFIGLKENYDNIEVLAGDRILLDKSASIKFSPVDHLAFFASFCYYLRYCI